MLYMFKVNLTVDANLNISKVRWDSTSVQVTNAIVKKGPHNGKMFQFWGYCPNTL